MQKAALLKQDYEGQIRVLEEQIRASQSNRELFQERMAHIREEYDRRKEAAEQQATEKAGLQESSYLKPKELRTITDLEKLLTKKGFASMLGELVVKPQGKPALVEDSDPRPEMNTAQEDFNDYTK